MIHSNFKYKYPRYKLLFMVIFPRYFRSQPQQGNLFSLYKSYRTGRYKNKPLGERTCVFCTNSSVKDEKHFLDCKIGDTIKKTHFAR